MRWICWRKPEATPNPELEVFLAELQRSAQAEMDAATVRVEAAVRDTLRGR